MTPLPLCNFTIPYDLSYTTLLQQPTDFSEDYSSELQSSHKSGAHIPLSAWTAEDPHYWDGASRNTAVQRSRALTTSTYSLLNILTESHFQYPFNILRSWEDLSDSHRTAFIQVLKSLCINTSELLNSLPDADDSFSYSPKYISFAQAILERSSVTESSENDSKMAAMTEVGEVLRSLINVTIFLVNWCVSCLVKSTQKKEKSKSHGRTTRVSTMSPIVEEESLEGCDPIFTLLSSLILLLEHSKFLIAFSAAFGGENTIQSQVLEVALQCCTSVSTNRTKELPRNILDVSSGILSVVLQYFVNSTPSLPRDEPKDAPPSAPPSASTPPPPPPQEGMEDIPIASPVENPSSVPAISAAASESSTSTPSTPSGRNMRRSRNSLMQREKSLCHPSSEHWMPSLITLIKKGKFSIIIDAFDALTSTLIPPLLLDRLVQEVRALLMFSPDSLSSANQVELANMGQFLEAFSGRFPLSFLAHFERLKNLLGVEVYQLRKSLIEIFKNMFIQSEHVRTGRTMLSSLPLDPKIE
ncbi:hypothetical protein IE077_003551, partial [Cardiosporidium cionae]